ncbi:hypothetical protein PsAD2_03010 [Pseudovibrio axinellae]|uniref:Uncharacterized protein n=1 Tax=Pseudovibrio axinellae TaxID=989403 RepID=A0A165XG69_9HYPH|nr:hypothetical protein [Pseudovibrio axinellae]KZL17674.1 hypothetical protein PsAD2_03010 [Pseudovibrio axinellae]SER44115.1 hypothetical protein SAMN05421798_11072 [Pseudovibrio axinellae]
MSFKVLSGKALSRAISGYGKTAASFAQRTHQLAYCALLHVEEHNCASLLTKLYESSPTNYRTQIREYACALGKVAFDTDKQEFAYSKGKKSDMETALRVSPAEFQREIKQSASASKSFADRLSALVEKEMKAESGDHALAKKLANFLKANEPKSVIAPANDQGEVQLELAS